MARRKGDFCLPSKGSRIDSKSLRDGFNGRLPPTIYEALKRLEFIFYLQTAGIIQDYKILGPNVDQVVSWQVSRILVWA